MQEILIGMLCTSFIINVILWHRIKIADDGWNFMNQQYYELESKYSNVNNDKNKLKLLKVGDRVYFNWSKFDLFNGYYPECVEILKKEYPKHKRYYITEVKPHKYFEYNNDYKINDIKWVHKEAVKLIKSDFIDKIIFNFKFRR